MLSQIRRVIKLLVGCWVAIALVVSITMTAVEAAPSVLDIKVYRDPSCHCCGKWMDHLTAQGFQPENISESDMDAFKQEQGVPADLTSCHTAVIDGYLIEGHVPAADIKRLLAERPAVAGLAAPGMPMGSPGMESEDEHDDFTVFSFDSQGHAEVFSEYAF